MKVLFVVYHPVDPQLVVNVAKEILQNGGEVLFIIVEKEGIIEAIIKSYGYRTFVIGTSKSSVLGKILSLISFVFKFNKEIYKFKPDLIFSPSSPHTSLACALTKTPLICWADTETATVNIKYSAWRINSLLLPESFYIKLPYSNQILFNGYKELAYLHSNHFKADASVLSNLGLKKEDKIVLMRFSALNAMHDIGLKSEAVSNDDRILEFILKIEKEYNARVFISVTERDLDKRFDKYKLRIDPSKYIHLLAFCSLYIGEGTTTASESGVLGIPWIALRDKPLGYLIDQEENYGLGIRTDNIDIAFNKAEEYLSDTMIRQKWQEKRKKLIEDKIDVSAFIGWFIENYPKSHKIMKENPDYQNRFK